MTTTALPTSSNPTADPKVERIDLPVTGMTGAACARHVEHALADTPGVAKANVNFATSKATVEYDATKVDRAGLRTAVESAGYGVAEAAPGGTAEDDDA